MQKKTTVPSAQSKKKKAVQGPGPAARAAGVVSPQRPKPSRSVQRGYTRSDPASADVQATWAVSAQSAALKGTGNTVVVTKSEVFDYVVCDATGNSMGWWSINPANNIVFPWLSRMAGLFEQFRFKRLSFEYTPTCNYVATGQMCMCLLYDASDEPSLEVSQLSAYEGSRLGAVRTPIQVTLDPSKVQLSKYQVLENGLYRISRTSCPCLFAFRVMGTAPNESCGRLVVHYTIEYSSSHFPEGVLAPHLGYIDQLNTVTYAGLLFPLGFPVTIPQYSVPGWITCTDPNNGEYNVSDGVDTVCLSVYGRSGDGHPNAISNWLPDRSPDDVDSSLFLIHSPPNTGALVWNKFFFCTSDLLNLHHGCSCDALFARPNGTSGDWRFRIYFNPSSFFAYGTTHWAHWVIRFFEAPFEVNA